MYSEKIQLELLDEIVQTWPHDNISGLNLAGPYRDWNYKWLVEKEYLARDAELTGVQLTSTGEQRRYELRKDFAREAAAQLANENIAITRQLTQNLQAIAWAGLIVAGTGLVVAVIGLIVAVAPFFQGSATAESQPKPVLVAPASEPSPESTEETRSLLPPSNHADDQ